MRIRGGRRLKSMSGRVSASTTVSVFAHMPCILTDRLCLSLLLSYDGPLAGYSAAAPPVCPEERSVSVSIHRVVPLSRVLEQQPLHGHAAVSIGMVLCEGRWLKLLSRCQRLMTTTAQQSTAKNTHLESDVFHVLLRRVPRLCHEPGLLGHMCTMRSVCFHHWKEPALRQKRLDSGTTRQSLVAGTSHSCSAHATPKGR